MRLRTGSIVASALTAVLLIPHAVAVADGAFVEPASVISHVTIHAGRVYFGWAVSELGDVNGDGARDFIAGAPLINGQHGAAFVYSGATGKRLYAFHGRPGDQAGWAVADAGDVNADGVHDVLVGAPGAGGPGRATVYSGANGDPLLSWAGHAEGDRFGYAVAGVGDLNGDGHDDVMVGAPGDDRSGTDAGRATVFSGANGRRLRVLRGSPGDRAGVGVDGVSDTNGDGVGDLVVGARDAGPGLRGQVSMFSGATGERLWVADAARKGVDFGTFFVAGLDDLNGDGTPDVYAADYSDRTHGPYTGRAYLLSGADGTPIREFVGSGPREGLGPGREAGDVDGDGVSDLIVGSYLSSDGALQGGKVQIVSGATGAVLRTLTGTRRYDNVGFDAVGLDDVNGDGIPDELISAANRNDLYVVAGVPTVSAPDPASALDFWVGTWNATWDDGHGTNDVTREYGGHAIVERFTSEAPEAFRGMSLSVFDPAEETWRQVWVDTQGNRWWFTGGPAAEGFIFTATERKDGVSVLKRMVFSDLRRDAFDWRWERSDDGGRSWGLLWAIAYRRRGSVPPRENR